METALPSSASSPRRFRLTRRKMLAFLDELKGKEAPARTLYLPPGNSAALKDTGEDVPAELPGLVAGSKTGAVLFWGKRRYLVLPPFPVQGTLMAPGCHVEPLRSQFQTDYTIAFILLRMGAYAIGVARGEELIGAQAGTGLVHARHRQGGSSAHRFERHREKQIEYFLTRVCGHVRELLEPQAGTLDYIVYGGARETVLLLRKRCDFLNRLDLAELPPLYTIPQPRRSILPAAVQQVWSSLIFEWTETPPF